MHEISIVVTPDDGHLPVAMNPAAAASLAAARHQVRKLHCMTITVLTLVFLQPRRLKAKPKTFL